MRSYLPIKKVDWYEIGMIKSSDLVLIKRVVTSLFAFSCKKSCSLVSNLVAVLVSLVTTTLSWYDSICMIKVHGMHWVIGSILLIK